MNEVLKQGQGMNIERAGPVAPLPGVRDHSSHSLAGLLSLMNSPFSIEKTRFELFYLKKLP